jgi:pyruvate/2-oxoglutarate/acetoin dehydrogenase E1 component
VRKLSYARVLNRALAAEMERDPTVFVLGEDNGYCVPAASVLT